MSYTRYASLQGRVVFVSGGSSGIGAELVRAFAQQGARVAFCGTRPDGGQALAAELAAAGLAAPWYAACDVRDVAAYQAGLARAAAELGPIRVLVNNAGRDDRHRMEDVTPEFWDDRLALNLRHYFFAIQAVAPGMEKAGGGSVVNMSSACSSVKGAPNRFLYGTTKAAVIGLTKSIAVDYVSKGIRCNCLCPGTVDTPSLHDRIASNAAAAGGMEQARAAFVARQAMGRLATAEEMAALVVYLAAPESTFVTGQAIVIDGGWTL